MIALYILIGIVLGSTVVFLIMKQKSTKLLGDVRQQLTDEKNEAERAMMST